MPAPEDLLRVVAEHSDCTDTMEVLILSRHFDLRKRMAFISFDAPPADAAIQITMAAFSQLFRAYYDLPFSVEVLKPLVAATVDRLLPELLQRLATLGRHRVARPQRLIADPYGHHRVENFAIQGAAAFDQMDRMERALRERQPGELTDLTRGTNAAQPREPDRFFPDDYFRRGVDGRVERVTLTATEVQVRRQEAYRRARQENFTQIHRHAYEIENAMFWGTGARNEDSAAVARARETLVHCLSDPQKAEFERKGSFTVVAQDGRLFHVLTKRSFNVCDVNHEWYYCCQPSADVPIYDGMLACKLWLEADLQRFMATANRQNRRTGQHMMGRQETTVQIFDDIIRGPNYHGLLQAY